MLRTLLLAACLGLAAVAPAHPVDPSDSATYLVMNDKGQTTAKAIRMQFHRGEWILMDRTTLGDWVHVKCDLDCKMVPSTEADIRRFMPPNLLDQINADCIHSKAIAFCGFRNKASPATRHYLFVSMAGVPTVAVRLARVMPDGKVVP